MIIKKSDLKLYILTAISIIIISAISRKYFIETYSVVSRSMAHTLFEGDKVLVRKTNVVQLRDVTVFKKNGYINIKRCVGLPGDTVQFLSGRLLVNQRKLDSGTKTIITSDVQLPIDPLILKEFNRTWTRSNFGPYIVPYKGLKITLDQNSWDIYGSIIRSELTAEKIPTKRIQNSRAYVFKKDYYFLAGDNRPYSEDSRSYGAIVQDSLIGTGTIVLYSKKKLGRILKRI